MIAMGTVAIKSSQRIQTLRSKTYAYARDRNESDSKLRMPLPSGVPDLPNPIAELERDGAGSPPEITKLEPSSEQNDGTSVSVHFKEVEGVKMPHKMVMHRDGKVFIESELVAMKANGKLDAATFAKPK